MTTILIIALICWFLGWFANSDFHAISTPGRGFDKARTAQSAILPIRQRVGSGPVRDHDVADRSLCQEQHDLGRASLEHTRWLRVPIS